MGFPALTTPVLTQADLKSPIIGYLFTVTDSDPYALNLEYSWQIHGGSGSWKAATVTGPFTIPNGNGGVDVTGTWNLGADYDGSQTTEPVDFRVLVSKPLLKASGTLTAVAANATTGIAVGDRFDIGPVFEFTTTPGPLVSGNNPVLLPSETATAAQVKTAIIDAVNSLNPQFSPTASAGAGNVINLTYSNADSYAITQHTANAGVTLTPTGFANGSDAQTAQDFVISFPAHTGYVPGDVNVLDGDTKTAQLFRLDQTGAYGAGVLSIAWLQRSVVYEALSLLVSGARKRYEYVADRAQKHDVRAVLLSVDEYANFTDTSSVTVKAESKQWLATFANKAMTKPTFFAHDKMVFAITNNVTDRVTGKTTATTLAYLMSYNTYKALGAL